MNVKIEDAEKNVKKLEIEVPLEDFDDALSQSFKKNAKRFNVAGFRKGRAPRHVIERIYGQQVLYEDAVDIVCPKFYELAVKEYDIEPVDSPELGIVELERGKPFVFSAKVTVKPEVVLGKYIGVEATQRQVLITEEDVEAKLGEDAEKIARLVPIEDRPSMEGDTLLIDYEGSIDGVPFEGGKSEGFNLELGSKAFIGGFEEQLTGKSAGDETLVNVHFPDDYHSEDVRGKDAVFSVKVHSIKRKELPNIDDEFAQDVSEFETLDEYKADIRKKLTQEQEELAMREFENELVDKIVKEAEIDVPAVMIDNQAERDVKDFEMRLAYQGMDMDRYCQIANTTREAFEASMRERAEPEIRTSLVLEKIGKQEAIEVTDEDFEAELTKRAETYKKSYEEYKKQITDDLASYIRSRLKTDKTVKFITDNAARV